MIKAVLDTNVLVSALLVAESPPARILGMTLYGKIVLCYDSRIMMEYKTVLFRPKFPFQKSDVDNLLEMITSKGVSVLAEPQVIPFADINDRKFYEVALSMGAFLITGNGKHYPAHQFILSPAEFMQRLGASS